MKSDMIILVEYHLVYEGSFVIGIYTSFSKLIHAIKDQSNIHSILFDIEKIKEFVNDDKKEEFIIDIDAKKETTDWITLIKFKTNNNLKV